MMKKTIFTILMVFACFATAMAQQAKIGYFSYDEVLQAMPEYAVAMTELDALRSQYAEELKNAEEEFNDKFEVFLEQQSTLAPTIREKRQSDLQNLLDRNTQFRKEADRLVAQAEKEMLAPIKEKLAAAVRAVGSEGAYLVILNTDSEAAPYIDANLSENITTKILSKVK